MFGGPRAPFPLLKLSIQGVSVDPKAPRRSSPVPADASENLLDMSPLDLSQGEGGLVDSWRDLSLTDVLRKVIDLDLGPR